jgi:hypothetical protein
VVGFEGNGRLGSLGERGRDSGRELPVDEDGLRPVDTAGRLDVAAVREEQNLREFYERERVRALEPRQIPDVNRIRDEEGCGSDPLELGTETLDSPVQDASFLSTRKASASR